MIHHLLNDIYCVEVAEDAREHRINYEGNGTPHFMADLTGGYYHDIELPMGRWQFLFLSNEVTEERAAGIVEKNGEGFEYYMSDEEFEKHDYIYALSTALESFQSLLKSKNLTDNQAIMQKIK